jgi:hypothetical protein
MIFLLILQSKLYEYMKKGSLHKIVLILLTSLPIFSYAQVLQNMVKNPSFEQYSVETPDDIGQIERCAYWSAATKAGADYFHERARGANADAPYNKMGKAQPKSGKAYAGFYAYASRYSKRNFREYLQVKLNNSL